MAPVSLWYSYLISTNSQGLITTKGFEHLASFQSGSSDLLAFVNLKVFLCLLGSNVTSPLYNIVDLVIFILVIN